MSDILTTSLLDIERVARIAGDEGLGSQLEVLKTELKTTQNSVSTEVLHRSEGDLVIQRILEGYIQDLLKSKSEELDRYLEFQNDQNLNYTEVKNFVTGIRYAIAEEVRTLSSELAANLQANDARFNKLSSDVSKYLTILSDVTLDSNQITLDNGELRAGAWTILSQARQWDLEILSKLRGLEGSVGDGIRDAVEELQNQIPSTEETISKALEELSNAPFIKDLSDDLSSAIEDLTSLDVELAREAAERQRGLARLAAAQAEALAAEKRELLDKLVKESQDRVSAIEREANIRNERLLEMAEDLTQQLSDASDATRVAIETDLADIRKAINQETEDRVARIKDLEDGFTKSVEELVEGDKTILNSFEVYKKSNDSVLSSVSTEIQTIISDQTASASRVDAIDLRLKTNEGVAATAVSKAEAAITENSAQAKQIDSINVSLSDKVGSSAMAVLEASVSEVEGLTVSQGKQITALEADYAALSETMDTKVSTDAFSSLTTEVRGLEDSVETQTTDITSLKGDMETVKGDLTKKASVDAVNDLTVRMVEEEGKSSVAASEITKLKTNLDTTNRNVNTKASTEAVNALSADVVSIGDKTTVNTSDITKLNSSLSKVEGALEKKFDASAISDYYTKAQSDDKADEIAAGKIDSFSASLMVGGDNVLKSSNVPIVKEGGAAKYFLGGYTAGLASADMVGKRFTLTACVTVKNIVGTQYLCAYQSGSKQILFEETALTKDADKAIVHAVFDWTISTNTLNFYLYPNRAADSTNAEVTIHWAVMTEGESIKAASWIPSSIETADSLEANAKAIQSTNSEVSRVDGRVDITNSDVTKLTGRLSKVEGGLETKASVEAFQSLTTDIKSNKDAIAVNTNSITKLGGDLEVVENGLSKKLDSSVMVDYYTKQQADANALSTAAGEVSKYDAKLSTDSVNIAATAYRKEKFHVRESTGALIADNSGSNVWHMMPIRPASDYYINTDIGQIKTCRIAWYDTNGLFISGRSVSQEVYISGFVIKSPDNAAFLSVSFNYTNTGTKQLLVANSSKPVAYSEAVGDIAAKIDANASAIQTTNSEVTKVGEKTSANSDAITGLNSRLGTVEGQVSTKAEASALQNYYTKTEAAANATTVAAGEVSKYDASLSIGLDNLLPTQIDLWENGYWRPSNGASESGSSFSRTKADVQIPVIAGEQYSLRSNTRTVLVFYSAENTPTGSHDSGTRTPPTTAQVFTIPANSTYARAYLFSGSGTLVKPVPFDQEALVNLQGMLVKGTHTKLVWQHSALGTSNQINANATAITNTNAEVSRVDGRVTTESNRITALTGRVSTVEGNLTTKADVSAVNALNTRVGEIEGGIESQASEITTLSSKIDSRAGSASLVPDYLMANANEWRSHYGYNLAPYFVKVTDGKITDTVFRKPANVGACWNYSRTAVPNDRTYKLSMWVRRAEGSAGTTYFTCNLIGPDGIHDTSNSYAGKNVPATNQWTYVEQIWNLTGNKDTAPQLAFGFALNHASSGAIAEMQGFKVEAVISTADTDSTLATADALNSTNTEVSRINGEVKAQSTQLTELNAAVAGKAGADALSSLKADVEDVGNKYTSQAQQLTDLNANLSSVITDITISDTRSTNEPPSWYWAKYKRRRVNEFKSQSAIGVSGMFPGTYCNLETAVYYSDSSGGPIIQTATSGDDPSLYVQRQSSGRGSDAVWTAWKQPIKDLRDTLADKASASAVSSLDAKVVAIDGRVTSQASQITTLKSASDDNKNALTIQAKVLDGVKSSYMVKMETNGVIGGFGMIQESGAMGTVTTTFGVNADNFFIGAPSGGKKPFIVTTKTQTINGVSYPAGTWIDVALIANATIGTAHIADASITNAKVKDLDASKITTGVLDAGRIRVGSSTQFDTGYGPGDVLDSAKTYVNDNTGNLLNNTTLSGTSDKWSSAATVTQQEFFGKTVPVLTLSGTTNLAANSSKFKVDPSKAYEVSFWAKADVAIGTMYFGLHAYNSSGTNVGVISISNSSGSEGSSPNTNFYFWSGSGASLPVGDWRKYTAYIMPVGTDASAMKGIGENISSNAKFVPDTTDLAIRWYNYTSGSQSTKWAANFKCVEVDPKTILAAKLAQDIANAKPNTYVSQPEPPYSVGDIYRNGSSIYVATRARSSGSYTESDWTLVGDVTANNTAADSNRLGGTAASTVVNNAAKGIEVYNDVMSDLKITPVEKTALNTEWVRIKAEYTNMLAHAASLAVSTTAYTSAYNALNSTSPSMTSILGSMTTTTSLTSSQRDALRTQFTNYYAQVTALNKAISDKVAENAKAYTDAIEVGGANLLYRSYDKDLWTRYGSPTLTLASDSYITDKVMITQTTFEGSGGSSTLKVYRACDNLEVGKTLTISATVKNRGAQPITVNTLGLASANDLTIASGDSARVVFTDTISAARVQFRILTKSSSDAFAVDIFDLKFEYGSKATSWTPSTSEVNALIEGKARTFINTPTVPYNPGDIWKDGTTTKVSLVYRETGSFTASDWVLVGDVTADNTAADTAKVNGVSAATVASNASKGATVYADVMSDLKITPVEKTAINQEWNRIQKEYASLLGQAQALGITTTAYTSAYTGLSTTSPAMSTILASMSTTTTLTASQRDAYKTQYTTYYTQAVAITKAINEKIAENAKAQADAKSTTFTAQPTIPYSKGDLWKDGTTIKVSTVTRTAGSYTASDWVLVGDVTSANTAANSNQLGGKASSVVFNDITSAKNAADTAAANASTANTQLALWKYPNTTYIDGGKIYANSVTANQISVGNLSAISATIGVLRTSTSGARTEIRDNLITVYDSSNRARVKIGIF